jgi:TetR/AcrR family transcriptional regulator
MKNQADKRPGRPDKGAACHDVRSELMQIAAHLFAEKGYASVSLKETGRAADVTPAMIAYYFKDKAGLLDAVMTSAFERLLEVMNQSSKVSGDTSSTELFIERYMDFLFEKPWFPQIMSREVMSQDTKLRTLFIENVVKRFLQTFPSIIVNDKEKGLLRSDLDPHFTILSLIGMCDFAYISAPVMGDILGYETNSGFNKIYTQHVLNLFMRGAGTKQ